MKPNDISEVIVLKKLQTQELYVLYSLKSYEILGTWQLVHPKLSSLNPYLPTVNSNQRNQVIFPKL